MTPEPQSITPQMPRTNESADAPRRRARGAHARTNLSAAPRALPRAHSVGRWGEEVVSRILEANGYRIVDRNWRPPAGLEHEQIRGEIDIVAIDPDDELVFIEVKTRSTESLDFARFRIDAIAVTGTCETLTFEHLKGVA